MKKPIRLLLLVTACALAPCASARDVASELSEATVAGVQQQLASGALTSEQLVRWYLDRISAIDQAGPELRSIIEVNPDALVIAREMDAQRNGLALHGPLYGIPIIIKANIDTGDRMATSAGSLALANHHPPEDAFVVTRLRQAGAIVLGKANLSEWANFRSRHSSSGWSSLGGQTRNPYSPARNPCGSSSGSAVAVAANLTLLAVGTETDGSVVCPAGQNGIVGIKPSLGLVSRRGIIPIAHSQDTAGPMARTVRDAALLLAVMAGKDPHDSFTDQAPVIDLAFVDQLSPNALRGKRIGVIRNYYGAGSNPDVEAILDASIASLQAQGAEVIEDIEIDFEGVSDAEWEVLLYEFKSDLNTYLEESGAPIGSLAGLIEFNKAHAERVMPFFGQDIFIAAEAKTELIAPEYRTALDNSKRISMAGIDKALSENQLDALIAPTNSPAWLTDHVLGDHFQLSSSEYAAVSGYPNVTVPAGFVSGLPIGLSFIGPHYSDEALIRLAYAFEQATQKRRPPKVQ
jgi:amidase